MGHLRLFSFSQNEAAFYTAGYDNSCKYIPQVCGDRVRGRLRLATDKLLTERNLLFCSSESIHESHRDHGWLWVGSPPLQLVPKLPAFIGILSTQGPYKFCVGSSCQLDVRSSSNRLYPDQCSLNVEMHLVATKLLIAYLHAPDVGSWQMALYKAMQMKAHKRKAASLGVTLIARMGWALLMVA